MKSVRLYPWEKIDDLVYGELKLIQRKDGYRYSVDALLLSHFVLLISKGRVIDLGCGTGVISLILAKRSDAREIIGVEIQGALAGRAKRNVRLNNLEHRIKIIHKDLRKIRSNFKPESFDLVLSNPPFVPLGSGKISQNREKAIARHELKLNMKELIEIGAYLVKRDGSIAFIYPFRRLKELISCLKNNSIYPYRLKFVYHKKQDNVPELFCLEAKKITNSAIKIEPPYIVETEKGRFHLDRD